MVIRGFGIVVGNILEKVTYQLAKGFVRLDILLAAMRTIPFCHFAAAVQAGGIFPQVVSAHRFWLLFSGIPKDILNFR
ncbi:hypothetical protein MKQ70_01715 [Chitinophaga sedimenti]|uniref:hypothetical protein n=1 Tax=Chitinophaga sedimenti TaxID=2033606 RepID=UPI0020058931|nr:hypothetical protein [Chitinophaga sedimenti]MCK7553788.1 hypothetical protein [Chitinophaga sedimenti]